MAISLLREGLSILKPCPTVHNMWNRSFLKECFFLWFLCLWKESQEEKYKRSQNTYYSQCDSAGNRRARKESKIEISWEGAEKRRQERSLMSCREARITCLFIDLINLKRQTVRLQVTTALGLFASLSHAAHLMQLGTEWRIFQAKGTADHS